MILKGLYSEEALWLRLHNACNQDHTILLNPPTNQAGFPPNRKKLRPDVKSEPCMHAGPPNNQIINQALHIVWMQLSAFIWPDQACGNATTPEQISGPFILKSDRLASCRRSPYILLALDNVFPWASSGLGEPGGGRRRGESEVGEWWVVYVHWGLSGLLVLDEWQAKPNKPQRIGVEGLSRQELTA